MREILYAADPSFIRTYLQERENAKREDIAAARELFPDIPKPGSSEAVEEIYSRDGDTAIIRIEGPMSVEGPDAFDRAYGYGGVSYQTIIAAMERARTDFGVNKVRFLANTPGGTVVGADATWQAHMSLRAKKPTACHFSNMLASAGYYIMCPSRKILASVPTDEAGSIGVILVTYDYSGALEEYGIKRIEIRSRNAPKKAPNAGTPTGRDALQERIDAAERIFYSRIAEARRVTPQDIAARFGQGALLVARDPSEVADATKSGMIDGLVSGNIDLFEPAGDPDERSGSELNNAEPLAQANSPANAGNLQEVPYMNLSEFLAQGPAAVAEIDKIKSDASLAAIAPINARMTKCATILASDVYAGNAPVRTKAIACLKGEISVDALEGVIGMADMLAEQQRQNAAAGEQQGQGDTRPGTPEAMAQEAAEIKAMADLIAGKKEDK